MFKYINKCQLKILQLIFSRMSVVRSVSNRDHYFFGTYGVHKLPLLPIVFFVYRRCS